MEQLSDFEHFLIKNEFEVSSSENVHKEVRNNPLFHHSPVKKAKVIHSSREPRLNDFESYLLENDFTENPDAVDYFSLTRSSLFHSSEQSPLCEDVENSCTIPRLNDFEFFLLRNDFMVNPGEVHYSDLTKNSLFETEVARSLFSQGICELCSHSSNSTLLHLQHMSSCQRRKHRRPLPFKPNIKLSCGLCSFKTRKSTLLELHEANTHRCSTCTFIGTGLELKKHHRTYQHGGKLKKPSQKSHITSNNPFKQIKAFKGYVRTYRESGVRGANVLNEYFSRTKEFVRQLINDSLRELKVCKAQFSVYVTLRRYLCKDDSGRRIYEVINKPMNSRMSAFQNSFEFDRVYNKWCSKIRSNVGTFERYGSGWVFSRVTGADLRVGKWLPQRGGCYMRTPPKIVKKKAVVNVFSRDSQCFKWAVLAALHQSDLTEVQKKNPNRSYYYKEYEKLYDFSCVEFPVEVETIPKFEALNDLAINVFTYDWKDGILPVLMSNYNYKGRKTIDLLLICSDYTDDQHYATITDINRLLGKKNLGRRLLCYICLNTFPLCKVKCKPSCKSYCKLASHVPDCKVHKYQRIKMPVADSDGTPPIISFKNFKKQLRADYVVYADFESLLVEDKDNTLPNQEYTGISYTEKQVSHLPCGFAYVVVDADGNLAHGRVYRNPDAVEVFLRDLSEISNKVFEIYEDEEEMKISPQQQLEFEAATHCHICELELIEDKVRDHDHRTGLYRGAAHNSCNMMYFQENKLPVIMHNFRGYDSHFVVKGFDSFGDKVFAIPTNTERFMSVSVDGIIFIDSLLFLTWSLDTLVENLAKGGNEDNFKLLQQLFPDTESLHLLMQKGVYPYDYFKTWDVFEETTLPNENAFYNQLRKERIKKGSYLHAQKVFSF